jgi:hypothetical protein
MKLLFSCRFRRNVSKPSGFLSRRRITVAAFFGLAIINFLLTHACPADQTKNKNDLRSLRIHSSESRLVQIR